MNDRKLLNYDRPKKVVVEYLTTWCGLMPIDQEPIVPILPAGEGWQVVSMTANGGHLFWLWKRIIIVEVPDDDSRL